VINARAETAHERPMFRKALVRRRCLVAADGFYEWKRNNGRKRPSPRQWPAPASRSGR